MRLLHEVPKNTHYLMKKRCHAASPSIVLSLHATPLSAPQACLTSACLPLTPWLQRVRLEGHFPGFYLPLTYN